MAVGADEPVLGAVLGRRRLHSVESLARENDLDPRTLRNVLVARGLVPNADRGSPYHVFDADAGRAVAAQVRRAVHVIALPKALNCTRPQASQLMDERLLSLLCDDAAHAPGRTRKTVDMAEIGTFLEKLRGLSRPVTEVPDGLVPIAKAAERAKTGSGEIMQLILAGFLKTVARRGLRREMGQGGRQAGQGPGRAADLPRLPRGTLETRSHVYPGLRPFRAETRHWRVSGTPFTLIESTFATVRHRTNRTKGCLSRKTGLAMAFRLMVSAQKKWRKLDGQNRLPEVISGVEFRDGVRQLQTAA